MNCYTMLFSDILDFIPISSIKIAIELPLHSSLEETLSNWYHIIKFVLSTYDNFSNLQQNRRIKQNVIYESQ